MGIGPPRHGQLDTSDRRIVAGILQGNPAVGERPDEALVIEDERDPAASDNQFAGQVDEFLGTPPVQPYGQIAHNAQVARGFKDDVAQVVDGVISIPVESAEGNGLYVVVQVEPARKLLHDFNRTLAVQATGIEVRSVVWVEDLIEASKRVGVDAVFSTGKDMREPQRLSRLQEGSGSVGRYARTPFSQSLEPGAFLG